jgi:hypothetical protein
LRGLTRFNVRDYPSILEGNTLKSLNAINLRGPCIGANRQFLEQNQRVKANISAVIVIRWLIFDLPCYNHSYACIHRR